MGSSLGAAVPLICWVLNTFLNVTFGSWTLWIWPSSLFLLSTDGAEHSKYSIIVLAVSVLINILLYSLIALLLAFFFRKLGLIK
jgi:hypothetical protein